MNNSPIIFGLRPKVVLHRCSPTHSSLTNAACSFLCDVWGGLFPEDENNKGRLMLQQKVSELM